MLENISFSGKSMVQLTVFGHFKPMFECRKFGSIFVKNSVFRLTKVERGAEKEQGWAVTGNRRSYFDHLSLINSRFRSI